MKTVAIAVACAVAVIASSTPGQAAIPRAAVPTANSGKFHIQPQRYSATLFVSGPKGATRIVSGASVRPMANQYGPKNFTPQSNTFAATDANGTLQSKYNYASPGTYSWRYEVNPADCSGGVLKGSAVANIYNNGGLVPNTHYSKSGVSPCYGFHASFPGNSKINTKGNYELSGGLSWKVGNKNYDLDFVFRFDITLV